MLFQFPAGGAGTTAGEEYDISIMIRRTITGIPISKYNSTSFKDIL